MTPKTMPTLLQSMTPFPHTVEASASLAEAQALMRQHGIRHLAVTVDGVLESVISERDLHGAAHFGHHDDRELCVGDACPPRAYMADIHDPLDRILDAMTQAHIGAVLVTRDGDLVGIFTAQDACRLLAERLREDFPATPPDAAA